MFYYKCDLDEIGYYPEKILQQDIDKAWQEYELNQEIDAIERERSIRSIERDYQLERIAREAYSKKMSLQTIFKFFVEYSLSEMDKVKFWQWYYSPECD